MTDRIVEIASLLDADAISALFTRSYSQLLKDDYAPDILTRAMPFLSFAKPELISSGSYYLVKGAGKTGNCGRGMERTASRCAR